MWNSYWTFLDYLELRRRAEKRLARGTWLLVHTALFVVATIAMIANAGGRYNNGYFMQMNDSYGFAFWSFLLVVHAIFTYARSGAAQGRRSRAIEEEMRERLRSEDTYLSDNPKDLFRLHGILEDDVRKRNSAVGLLTLYTIVNALIWIPWVSFSSMRDSVPWQASPALAVLIFLPLLGFSAFSAAGRERALRKQMETLSEAAPQREEAPKQKRFVENSHMRLTDDGELMVIEDEESDPFKSKRR
ncbi:MAG: hypothetical protein U0694_13285 [Anaerolineae bacterium]